VTALVVAACVACSDEGGDTAKSADAGGEALEIGDLYGSPGVTGTASAGAPRQGTIPTDPGPSESADGGAGNGSAGSEFRDEYGRYLGPWAPYTMTMAESQLVIDAEILITHECMRALGYEVEESSSGSDGAATWTMASSSLMAHDPEWGIIDIELAREYGYKGAPWSSPGGLESPQPKRSRPPGFSEAMDGEGGCGEIAWELSHKDAAEITEEDVELDAEFSTRAAESARDSVALRDAIAEWSECMAAEGYEYADPAQAAGADWPQDVASDKEKATATADAECKAATDFIDRWDRARWDAESGLIDEYLPTFEKARSRYQRELDNALAIIAGEVTLEDSALWPALRDA
jgi:hypothetical protein